MFLLSFAVLIVATSAASVGKCENYSLIVPFDPSNLTAVPHYRRLSAYTLHMPSWWSALQLFFVLSLLSRVSLPIMAYTGRAALPKRSTFLGLHLYQKVEH